MKRREPGRKPAVAEDQSLIPLIQDTEQQVKQALELARARSQAEVAAAEQEAALTLQQARGEIPLRLERRHQQELARIQAGIRSGADELQEAVRAELRAAEQNFPRAVEAIVRAVWEGG